MDISNLSINGVGKYNLEGGLTLEIVHDDCPETPRDWDNLGIMFCVHGRYDLGDSNGNDLLAAEIRNSKAYREAWEVNYDFNNHFDLVRMAKLCDMIMLPLYLYDHSGITMNTTGFSCPWDSGQVGYIIVSKERARAEYGASRVTAKLRRKVEGVLRAEVSTYDEYISGEVYGYMVWGHDDDSVDSCFGYYGFDYMVNEIMELLDSMPEPV